MKRMLSFLLCLMLLCACVLPVAATAPTEPTATTDVPQPVPGASDTMAVVCLVLLLVCGAYLFFTFKRKK